MLLIASIILALFSLFTLFPLLLSVLAPLFKKKPGRLEGEEADYACIITAYKDIECAKNLVISLIDQKYTSFQVYLVADDCPNVNIQVHHDKLSIIKPPVPLHSKVKSIEAGIEAFVRPHTHLIIFDPDNLAHPAYLQEMNQLYLRGYGSVQGRRVAKNLDTKFACLDAFSEYYYNYTQRTVPFALGSSATIAGSGMALPVQLYKDFIREDIEKHEGKLIIAEDKMLQVYVIEHGHRIGFAEDAIVYDEKVSTANQVKRQRTRWITSYFQYFLTGVKLLFASLFRFNWNQILFAYTIIIPPMFIIGLVWFVASVLFMFVSISFFATLQVALIAFVANIFIALILGGAPAKVTTSLFYAPLFVFNQVLALFSMKQTKTSFLTTEKTKNISIDELMKDKS